MIEFREASQGEAPMIAAMVNELIRELGGLDLDAEAATAVARMLMSEPERGRLVVAVDGATLVGLCSMSYQIAIRTQGRYGIIQEMIVRSEQRGDGVGSGLLSAALEIAFQSGCRVVELGAPLNGVRQERFYAAGGFKKVGARMRIAVDSVSE